MAQASVRLTPEEIELDDKLAVVSRSYRLQRAGVKIDGGASLDFARYPFVQEIIDVDSRYTTIIKGAQLGISIACILKALEQAYTQDLRGILYLMPTHSDVIDFSKSRFGPLIENNAHMWGDEVRVSEASNLRELRGTFLFFRGAGAKGTGERNLSAIKSLPIDKLFSDERDEFSDARYDAARHRLDGSTCPEETILSTPTLPGYGVDLAYGQSDRRHWFWKCVRCNGLTCLETSYPDCIAEPSAGEPFYLCMDCREPLEKRSGRWIAEAPSVTDHRGYYVSQLSSPTRTAADVIKESLDADRTGRHREFYNQVLGRPYAEVEDVITEGQLLDCLGEEPRALSHPGPCAAGVDPGKTHHYEIRMRENDSDTRQVARGVAQSYDELAAVFKRYNVKSACIDQGFDPTAVGQFVKRFPGAYGALYVQAKKTDPVWDHKQRTVKVGREWLLDRAHHEILARRVELHAKDENWGAWVTQMTNLARTVVENEQTGERKPRWIVLGGQKNDHWRHAGALCSLACDRVALSKPVRDAYQRAHDNVRPHRRRTMLTM